jgi:hypothetical protein
MNFDITQARDDKIAVGSALPVAAATAAARVDSAEVDKLISQIQSQDESVRDAAWQKAATVGWQGVKPLAALMTHPDFEVARSSKRALWKTVRHAGRPKAENERKTVQAELVALLDAANAAVVRREVLWMLSEIGDASTAQSIARLLDELDVCEGARCALERMPGSEATRTLKKAMRSAPEKFRPALAHSLRVRGVRVEGYPSQKLKPVGQTAVQPK